MKAKIYTLLAVAALALAACTDDEDGPLDGPVELRLTSTLEVQTRATHNLDTQLKNGETVHVWVDDAGTGSSQYADNTLTADGSGGFTGGTAMYFPSTGNAVNIYALHGNFGSTALTDFWGIAQTHSVERDQQSTGNGYATSDLVYVASTDIARTKSAVELKFTHLLSKVEVVLVQGAGNPEIAKVEILNTKLSAVFTPSKNGETITVTESGTITDNNPIRIDADLTDATDATGTDESKKKLNEAIIVPQTLGAGTAFIRITTAAGGELIYSLPDAQTFDPAKKYRYIITANLTGLTVTATVDDWGNGGTNRGNAELQ